VSAPVELGETYQYRQTVTDSTGTPVTATVTATITLPDGSLVSANVQNTGVGIYDIDYPTVQAGRHVISGSATGGSLGSTVEKFDDVFHVEQPGRMLVSYDEAVSQLRASAVITSVADREQLRWLVVAASDAVERALGVALCRRTVTETLDGGYSALRLSVRPLPHPDGFITVTSVVESGGPALVAGTGYVLDRQTWTLLRGNGSYSAWWLRGYGNVAVTYDVGCTVVPPVIRSVTLASVEAMWQSSQQAAHPMLEPGADLVVGDQLRAMSEPERMAWSNLVMSCGGIA
jgi:hypothetical protein